MIYANKLNIIEYPFCFENTRKRIKRRNVGFNFPILLHVANLEFKNIIDAHHNFKDGGYSGLPMHYYIDKNANIYKCRPMTFQNGYAEHEDISVDEYVKNSILIQIEQPKSQNSNSVNPIIRAIMDLCAYICLNEQLCPQTDIFNFYSIFCLPDRVTFFDTQGIKDEVMNILFPNFNRNYQLLNNEDCSILIVPDMDSKYKTISGISSILAMSSDFEKWFPIANAIRRANSELINLLKQKYPKLTEDELLFVPIDTLTALISPPCPFEYVKKSIIDGVRANTAYKYIVNTYAESAKNIFLEIKEKTEQR